MNLTCARALTHFRTELRSLSLFHRYFGKHLLLSLMCLFYKLCYFAMLITQTPLRVSFHEWILFCSLKMRFFVKPWQNLFRFDHRPHLVITSIASAAFLNFSQVLLFLLLVYFFIILAHKRCVRIFLLLKLCQLTSFDKAFDSICCVWVQILL